MTIEQLKERGLIILECVSGSKAYGLDTPQSDTDIKGVFVLPKDEFFGLDYVPQISNETNDIVYYELGRFVELLAVNNPNILELLNTPKEAILKRDPLLDLINPKLFLSKLCENTFGKFALSQIKKARGLNKKILNPMDKERKSVLDFCYVNNGQGSLALKKVLELRGWKQKHCGLVNVPHMKDVFALFHEPEAGFNGIIKSENANEVSLSSIPKSIEPVGYLYFNQNGYSTYCKEYKEYWSWVEKRNETRYEGTKSHGKNYDAKNMMHTFRLLQMAIEIGKSGEINVQRPNREFLLDIKSGKFEYDDLMSMAQELQNEMKEAYEHSFLQSSPDKSKINQLLVELRTNYYK
ncbi:MAG: nucleotidyltransferase domain-containing protein [Flavobacteriales bacterium]|nr:nucleotidyltransferase domain-containing protein [Flavobacteriales bacterium]